MVAGLVEANVGDSRARAGVARFARGPLVLRTTDRDAAVTLTFQRDDIVITDGVADGAPSLAGPWLELAHVCTGRRSLFAAIAAGDLEVSPRRRPDLVAMAGFVLAAPAEDEAAHARRRRLVLLAVVMTLLILVVLGATRREDG